MTNVLIMSQPDDTHATYVKLALESKGHNVVLLYSADFPTLQTHTFYLKHDNIYWSSKGLDGYIKNMTFDVAWYRRMHKAILPESMHIDDVKNAELEISGFFQSVLHLLANNAVWVNPLKSRGAAMHKLIQLKVASEIGWSYPETLLSNDPKEIRDFIRVGAKNGVVYKTFSPLAWFDDADTRLMYTKKIIESDLPVDNILQVVPGIYQHYIEKHYELRVTYFNGYCLAVKIDSQTHDKAKHDWRYAPAYQLNIVSEQLPSRVEEKCRLLMGKLGLVFGCIDIIVTPDGEYIFLEVNEQGQFLWIEDVNPDIKMLDMFTNFLIAKGNAPSLFEQPNKLSVTEFRDVAIKHVNEAVRLHKGTALLR